MTLPDNAANRSVCQAPQYLGRLSYFWGAMPDHFNTLITYTSSIFLINVFELVSQAELSMICQAGITVATIAKIIHDIRQNRNNDQR